MDPILELFRLLRVEHSGWNPGQELLDIWKEALGTAPREKLLAAGKRYLATEVARPTLARYLKVFQALEIERRQIEFRETPQQPVITPKTGYRDCTTPFGRGMLVGGYPHESMAREGFEMRDGPDGFRELHLVDGYRWLGPQDGYVGYIVVRE